jgi:Asp-tRNA(Asn)/Glu-tRNA(Gln) amidotransferase A subunit family amidase
MPLAQVAGLPVGISALAAPGADRDLTELAERAHLSARR